LTFSTAIEGSPGVVLPGRPGAISRRTRRTYILSAVRVRVRTTRSCGGALAAIGIAYSDARRVLDLTAVSTLTTKPTDSPAPRLGGPAGPVVPAPRCSGRDFGRSGQLNRTAVLAPDDESRRRPGRGLTARRSSRCTSIDRNPSQLSVPLLPPRRSARRRLAGRWRARNSLHTQRTNSLAQKLYTRKTVSSTYNMRTDSATLSETRDRRGPRGCSREPVLQRLPARQGPHSTPQEVKTPQEATRAILPSTLLRAHLPHPCRTPP